MKSMKIATVLTIIAIVSTNLTAMRCYDNDGNPTRCGLLKRAGNVVTLGSVDRSEKRKKERSEKTGKCEHGKKMGTCKKCKSMEDERMTEDEMYEGDME